MDAPTDASAGPDQVDRGHVDAMMQQVNPNDVNAVLQFAIGPLDCAASLVSQQPGSLPEVHAIYFADVHTYVIKKAGIGGKDDWRCYDAATGKMVFNSHHPGKDPYAQLDPLGLNSGPPPAGPNGGGEWEAVCDVSGHNGGFKIRPKKLSMHGRQFIKLRDVPVLSVGKVSKLKAMSLGKTFSVAVEGGPRDGEEVLTISSDLQGRTIMFRTAQEELVAVAEKPVKTLILNAALGVGSELQLVVAPGVDCSLVLAAFLALQQVGQHVLKDAFGNFVMDPLQDHAVDQVVANVPGANQAVDGYNQANGHAKYGAKIYNRINQMMNS